MGLIAVTGHFERPRVKRLAKRAKAILQGLGAEFAAADIKKKKFNSKKVKLVVAVGGDGTLLRVVRELSGEKPIVGIAAGEKSVLMQVKKEKLKEGLESVVGGKWRVEKRMRLQAVADGKRLPLALNEVMLVNRESGAIMEYCLSVNGKKREGCKADACIVATPTGSTGHAYSAGGKKLKVGSGKIAIVPSNSLGRKGKAIYVGGRSRVVLSSLSPKQKHEVVLDGQPRFAVRKKLVVERGKDALFLGI